MFKRIITATLLFSGFCTLPVTAEIVTITQIEDIAPFVEKDTLVLFNIAEVLMDSKLSLGSAPWRKYIKKVALNWTDNPGINLHDALTLIAVTLVPQRPVEAATPSLIQNWQDEGITIMALTSRGKAIWYDSPVEGVDQLTEALLLSIGIDFTRTQMPEELIDLDLHFNDNYSKGILYANEIDKGELIAAIMQRTGYHPKNVVYVDDKLDSLKQMQYALEAMNIPYSGFLYPRTTIEHQNFNPMAANVQLHALLGEGVLLSDHDAEEIARRTLKDVDPDVFLIAVLQQIFIPTQVPDPI